MDDGDDSRISAVTYAIGKFTRVIFYYHEGDIRLAVPRKHSDGERGDLVKTIVTNVSIRTHIIH